MLFAFILQFNFPGLAMLAICGSLVLVAFHQFGVKDDDLLTGFMGVLAILLDATYRLKWGGKEFLRASAGGSLLWLPIWLFGVIWLLLGISRMILR